ncbi:MAG TPA: TIGR03619 family F420-dependent LLM class oxidoreductase [Xanthobacteraceae bacterium]|nr:TIGR03619 family F420-dependent LLM class oxidoreductase [Xanthobacteraceae bacterium]
MQLGIALPLIDIQGEPATVRDFAQAAEGLGYHHLGAPDHVLGANVANRPDWGNRNTSKDFFHDPFVLFGFLSACTRTIGFSTQVLILAQRQTALVAKQVASLDVLSGGRFRFGIGVGWNPVEFVGLNENFHNRGKRSEEQVAVMRALWNDQHVSFKGKWHTIDDAGINPRPKKKIPLWFGGHADVTLERTAKWGDGWIMLAHARGKEAEGEFDKLRRYVKEAGRDPREVGIEVWVSTAQGGPDDWREEFAYWKSVGVTHVTVNSTYARGPHQRIAGKTMADHLTAMKDYHAAVKDLV